MNIQLTYYFDRATPHPVCLPDPDNFRDLDSVYRRLVTACASDTPISPPAFIPERVGLEPLMDGDRVSGVLPYYHILLGLEETAAVTTTQTTMRELINRFEFIGPDGWLTPNWHVAIYRAGKPSRTRNFFDGAIGNGDLTHAGVYRLMEFDLKGRGLIEYQNLLPPVALLTQMPLAVQTGDFVVINDRVWSFRTGKAIAWQQHLAPELPRWLKGLFRQPGPLYTITGQGW